MRSLAEKSMSLNRPLPLRDWGLLASGLSFALLLTAFVYFWPWQSVTSVIAGLVLIVLITSLFLGLVYLSSRLQRTRDMPEQPSNEESQPMVEDGTAFSAQLAALQGFADLGGGQLARRVQSVLSENRRGDAGLNGAESVAVLFMLLEKSSLVSLLRELEPEVIRRILDALTSLPVLDQAQIQGVVRDFLTNSTGAAAVSGADVPMIRDILEEALGSEASHLLGLNLDLQHQSRQLEKLKWLEAGIIARLIADEHPQIKAVLVACLPEMQARALLMAFDDRSRQDVLNRLAVLEGLSQQAISELDYLLEHLLENHGAKLHSAFAGERRVAALLRDLEARTENTLLGALRAANPASADRVEELMLGYEQVLSIAPEDLEKVVAQLSDASLSVLMQSSQLRDREQLLSVLSAKRVANLPAASSDLSANGVELARSEFIQIARKMAAVGEVILNTRKVDVF